MGEKMSSRSHTPHFTRCLKLLVFIFDFIFIVTGIAVLTLGIWLKVELYIYVELTTIYYWQAPYVLIGVGCAIIVFGMLACCCTYKGHAKLLYGFTFFLIMVFIAELAVGISGMVFKGKLQKGFQQGLQQGIKEYETNEEKKKAMDGLQHGLHCCGINNYTDWFSVTKNTVPKSCCIKEKECTTSGEITGIYTKGCYHKVTSFMQNNMLIIGGTSIGFAFLQLFFAFLTFQLAKYIRKENYEHLA